VTTIGSHNLLIGLNVQLAHDCIVGGITSQWPNATIAGHVAGGRWRHSLGGFTPYIQFCNLGAGPMSAGQQRRIQDIPAYVDGRRQRRPAPTA